MKNSKFPDRYKRNLSSKNNFRFTEVVGDLGVQGESKPFKKLKFENTEEHSNGFRYKIAEGEISDFSFSFEEPKEQEKIPKIHSSEFKSKHLEMRGSPHLKKSEKYSTIYTLSSDSSKFPDDVFELKNQSSTKISEEKENLPSRSKEYLDFLPAKKYCKHCNKEVSTTVRMEMPTMPL